MRGKRMKVTVYQVFDDPREQQSHRRFLRMSSNWNTITAIILILLFWLYQKLIGLNISVH
jgi:hypothetical protein